MKKAGDTKAPYAVRVSPQVTAQVRAYCARHGLKQGFFVAEAILEKLGRGRGEPLAKPNEGGDEAAITEAMNRVANQVAGEDRRLVRTASRKVLERSEW